MPPPLHRSPALLHAGLLILLLGLPVLFTDLAQWPLYLGVPLAVYGLIVVLVPALRRSIGWLRVGNLDRWNLAATAGVIVVASSALVMWFYLMQPDALAYAEKLPVRTWSPLQLVLAGVFFSVVNATLEELLWGGVLQEALQTELGVLVGWLVQGVAFGAMHYRGFPSGVLGVCLASIYGLMLGWLRIRSQGMFLPILAHICADATIFTVIVLEVSNR
jgi:uncharacterized protein